jgi:hypothetical protein
MEARLMPSGGFPNMEEIARAELTVTIKYLIKMIRTGDPATRQMLMALQEVGRSKTAFQFLADVKRDFSDKARTTFHVMWTECGHRIRREVGDDVVLLDALRRVLPVYSGTSVHLYRGETWVDFSRQRHGMSWSNDINIARMFARGRNALDPGGGVLIESIAPPDAIISGPSGGPGAAAEEFEYVVDRRRLNEVRQLAKFPPA